MLDKNAPHANLVNTAGKVNKRRKHVALDNAVMLFQGVVYIPREINR